MKEDIMVVRHRDLMAKIDESVNKIVNVIAGATVVIAFVLLLGVVFCR